MFELYLSGLFRRHLHEEWLEKERVAQEEFRLKREREEAALKRKEEEEVNYISATFIRLNKAHFSFVFSSSISFSLLM